jgi:ATP-binding cassette subfamily C (CFTR/MRP) protein 1
MGFIGVTIVVMSKILGTSFNISYSLWLSEWAEDADSSRVNDTSLRDLRLGVYGALGIGEAVMTFTTALSLNLVCLNAANLLHSEMLQNVVRAPMSFFDITPMGRILNRFSRDIDICDSVLNMDFRMLMNTVFRVLTAFIIIGIETPFVILFILPLGVLYYFAQKFYIPTSRQMRRIASSAHSPIYVHFSESISGSASIRAYNAVDKFEQESNRRIDVYHSILYPSMIAQKWISTRLEFLGYTIVFISAIFTVISRGTLSPGTSGLILSYALTVTRQLNNIANAASQLETNVVSVERCLEYTQTPNEVKNYMLN